MKKRPRSDARRRPRRSLSARPALVLPRRGAAADDRFFRHLVSSLRNGVIAIHRDGTLALINEEAYRIFALPPDPRDLGRPLTRVLQTRPEIIRLFASAFELSTLPNRADLRLKDLDRVIGYTLAQVRDDAGAAMGAVMFFKDLTQVEQAEERDRLRDRLASLGEMAAGIAHELKNPLAGIEVMAGLLRRQVPESAAAQSLLADIISESKLANAIVVEMLEFVRPIRLQVEPTSLADVLHQAITMADTKVERGGVTVQVTIDPSVPAVEGDPHQLCQVFTNLLTNAYDALGGRGTVAIAAAPGRLNDDPAFSDQPPTPTVVVDVIDDGPGVPPELTDRIFNPFFTTKPQGSGLGLAIVRKIVDAHDGRVDSDEPRGRRHPLPDHAAGVDERRLVQITQGARRHMGRILIADDHDALRRGLVRGLTEAGHEVEEAANGNAAIEKLHEGYFDVVLSDLKMGGSDGLDVLRTTRALYPTTAVILMTAFGSVNTAVEAMKIGAFDYVQKPFEIEEMEVKIDKALEVRRMQPRARVPPRTRSRTSTTSTASSAAARR